MKVRPLILPFAFCPLPFDLLLPIAPCLSRLYRDSQTSLAAFHLLTPSSASCAPPLALRSGNLIDLFHFWATSSPQAGLRPPKGHTGTVNEISFGPQAGEGLLRLSRATQFASSWVSIPPITDVGECVTAGSDNREIGRSGDRGIGRFVIGDL